MIKKIAEKIFKRDISSTVVTSWGTIFYELNFKETSHYYLGQLLDEFFKTVDILISKKKFKEVRELLFLLEFAISVENNRWTKFLPLILRAVLRYRCFIQEIGGKEESKNNIEDIISTLDNIFVILLQRSFLELPRLAQFKYEFENFMRVCRNLDLELLKHLFSLFYFHFSGLITEAVDENYLPNEFKVSAENYDKNKGWYDIVISIVIPDIGRKIGKFLWYGNKEQLYKAIYLARAFFPNIDLNYFIRLAAIAAFEPKEIILEKLIEVPMPTEAFSTKTYFIPTEIGRNKTFELVHILFPQIYTEQKLQELIQQLDFVLSWHSDEQRLLGKSYLNKIFHEFIVWNKSKQS